ncbi:MAG TPA: hypothetical protein C5S50_01230 [Methanosarcinaceae archaeon]|nr:hypothetical protein [Methanosarcinaceae archaeon]
MKLAHVIGFVIPTFLDQFNGCMLCITIHPLTEHQCIFLVISCIILSILLIYALPLLVLRDYGGIDAIKESINIGKDNFTDTLILFVIIVVLNAIGGGIPLAFALVLPYTTICYTLAASSLIEETSNTTAVAGEIE